MWKDLRRFENLHWPGVPCTHLPGALAFGADGDWVFSSMIALAISEEEPGAHLVGLYDL